MPHVISRTPRMSHGRHPSDRPEDMKISSSVTRVIVKTPGNQKDFVVADDTSVRQFKEKLSAHFKCQMDQLVLVFMGRLLKDHDTLGQWGIVDGHIIHLVIKSKHGSRSLAHSSRNLSTNESCHQERNTKGKSSEVCQPADKSQASGESVLFVESAVPKLHTQDLEVGQSEHIAQILGNPSIQRLLSNMEFMQQFISEHLDMQQLIQQNPEVFHLLDNSDILCQTLELARSLATIQEAMQIQRPAQTLEHSVNLPHSLALDTIEGGNNVMNQSCADTTDQINSLQDPFGGNLFTALLAGQAPEEAEDQPSSLSLPSSQLSTTRVIYTSSHALSSITSTNTTISGVNCTSRDNVATVSTKDRGNICTIQQPARTSALSGMKFNQQPQEEDKNGIISLESSEQRLEDDLQLSDEQTNSHITGGMTQFLMSNPCLAAQMMMFMNIPQLSEQCRQQLPTFLQQTQLSDLLLSLANPKTSQAILQIEQGLQLLVTEAPILLPWVAPYLWRLGWLPAPSCNYPDAVPLTSDAPEVADPKAPECCHKSEAVLQRLQTLAGDLSHPLQAPEIRFSKQMECLQAMGFGNHHANLQALIATEGDTNAAICKLKRTRRF
ncbi:ubiquilin-like protein [Ochotona curzoniae]|uniref:ubiquilin-like protein n=1 Tax=Ochotona curzoniae TaxID=130825 RepID=UPI001B350D63|nr:ubiquilin-like protein [Ochotona curzoniae]